jgi:hypothetical protein
VDEKLPELHYEGEPLDLSRFLQGGVGQAVLVRPHPAPPWLGVGQAVLVRLHPAPPWLTNKHGSGDPHSSAPLPWHCSASPGSCGAPSLLTRTSCPGALLQLFLCCVPRCTWPRRS